MVRIEVKQRHIQDGVKGECFMCPVALAVTEITHCMTRVGTEFIKVYDEPFQKFEMPAEVAKFIEEFDDGDSVQPFSFDLPLLNKSTNATDAAEKIVEDAFSKLKS